MVLMIILERVFCIVLMLILLMCIPNIFRTFERIPEGHKDKGWVALTIILEVVAVVLLMVKLVIG